MSTARNVGKRLVSSNRWVLLLVIHTYVEQDGEEIIRLISARKATKRERARYEENS